MRLPRLPWRRVTSGRALPWVLATVFLATSLVNWWLLRSDRRHDAQVATVETTARRFLTTLTTFSASTIDGDVRRIKSFAVGDFAGQVQQTFSPARIAQIRSAKVVSAGRVQHVFVEDLSGTQATVFGVVSETVTNKSNPAPRADLLRVEVGMIDTTGGWRVNSVNILQSPGSTGVP